MYIHYGDDHFDPEKCKMISNQIYNKPDRGIWASPVNSKFGWKEWCDSEDYALSDFDWNKSFTFELKEGSKILNIRSEDDILPYIIPDESRRKLGFPTLTKTDVCDQLNREKLYKDFDGMELFLYDNWFELQYGIFYSWSCDSIVVWNPDIVIPM